MMEFAQPIGFWLGLAGVGVLAAHLVRRRAKRITVPFLPLWNAVLEGQRGGFGSALSRWLDLILMLLEDRDAGPDHGRPLERAGPGLWILRDGYPETIGESVTMDGPDP